MSDKQMNELDELNEEHLESVAELDPTNDPEWEAFLKFLLNDERPDWMPQDYEIPQDLKAQLLAKIDTPTDQSVLSFFREFQAINLGDPQPSQGVDFDFGPPEDQNDFLSQLQANYSPDNGSLLSQFEQKQDEGMEFTNNESLDFDLGNVPTDFDMGMKIDPSETNDSLDQTEQEDDVQRAGNAASETHSGQAAEAQPAGVDPIQAVGAGPQLTQPQYAYPAQPSTMQSLGQMVSSLAKSGANLVRGMEGVTAPISSWGSQKSVENAEKRTSISEKVNQGIQALAELSPAQALSHVKDMREKHLSTNMQSIADLMHQVRTEMKVLAESQPSGFSVAELAAKAKSSEDPKLAQLFKHQLKEFITEHGTDQLIESVEMMADGNRIIGQYAENAQQLAQRIGEDISPHLEEELAAYRSELEESKGVLSDLYEIAQEAGLLDEEQQAKMQGAMERFKESLGKLAEKFAQLFTKQVVAGPSM